MRRALALPLMLLLSANPAAARDALGVFDDWGAFRDPASNSAPLRCYAIAEPQSGATNARYITIATWPSARIRGQVHVRLAAPVAARSIVTLAVGSQRFVLTARGTSAWASDARMDAAIVAAIRSSQTMTIRVGAASASWRLRGAATAIDAAALGCARR